jgi:flagellar hook-basal body complex protein FliE
MIAGSVEFLPPISGLAPDTLRTAAASSSDFSAWLEREIDGVNRQILDAERQVRELAAGDAANLHQVMIALEEARLSFQLMLQTRNHLLEAYQDILRMQV